MALGRHTSKLSFERIPSLLSSDELLCIVYIHIYIYIYHIAYTIYCGCLRTPNHQLIQVLSPMIHKYFNHKRSRCLSDFFNHPANWTAPDDRSASPAPWCHGRVRWASTSFSTLQPAAGCRRNGTGWLKPCCKKVRTTQLEESYRLAEIYITIPSVWIIPFF